MSDAPGLQARASTTPDGRHGRGGSAPRRRDIARPLAERTRRSGSRWPRSPLVFKAQPCFTAFLRWDASDATARGSRALGAS